MWAGSAEVSILREALGEALVVFWMTAKEACVGGQSYR